MQQLPGGIQLKRLLGTGGSGEVWLGQIPEEGRDVAVKVLLHAHTRTPRFRQRFTKEVETIASLRHPHIVPVYGFGALSAAFATERFPENTLYLTMPRAKSGISHIRDWPTLAPILRDVLQALGFLHARGLLHRDLKPANVLLGPTTWLADFGVATQWRTLGYETSSGTPGYMAPEQIQGDLREQGPPTDLYAFAALVWVLTTGRPLFHGPRVAVKMSHLLKPPGVYSPLCDVPPALEAWLRWLLEKEPLHRPQSVFEAIQAFPDLAPTTESVEDTVPLVWSGAELLTLRPPRFEGREKIRAKLIQQLREVDLSRTSKAFVLYGPPGIGKNRLATWLCTEAHTTRGWWTHTVPHSDHIPLQKRWLQSLLDVHGLDQEDTERRLRLLAERFHLPDGGASWRRLLSDVPPDQGERTEILVHALSQFATRPGLIVVDSVHDSDLHAIIERLKQSPLPVCVVCTDTVGGAPTTFDLQVHLTPLPARSMRRLIRSIVHTDTVFLERLLIRANGNPGIALEILTSLWGEGRLQATGSGFQVTGAVPLPPRLSTDLRHRLSALSNQISQNALYALFVLAIVEGREEDWIAVCTEVHLHANPQLLHLLLRPLLKRGWLTQSSGTWAFHPLQFAETITNQAEQIGFAKRVHRIMLTLCAPDSLERRAYHHEALEEWELAFPLLQRAIEQRIERAIFEFAPLLQRLENIATQGGNPYAMVEYLRLRSRLEVYHYSSDQALNTLAEALDVIRANPPSTPPDLTSHARILVAQAAVLRRAGQLREALQKTVDAEALLQPEPPSLPLSAAWLERARIVHLLGKPLGAQLLLNQLIQLDDVPNSTRAVALTLLANTYRSGPAFLRAAHDAMKICKKEGLDRRLAAVTTMLGDHARAEGDLELAESYYTEVYHSFEGVDRRFATFSLFNLCHVALDRGDVTSFQRWVVRMEPYDQGLPALVQRIFRAIYEVQRGEEALARAQWQQAMARMQWAGQNAEDLCCLTQHLLALELSPSFRDAVLPQLQRWSAENQPSPEEPTHC